MPHRDPIRAEFFRAIAEYTYDWETWVGEDGQPQWINPAVERITGYTVEACLARDDYPLGLAHPEDRARLESVLQDAAAGGSGNDVEFRVLRRDGEARWVAISWQTVFDAAGCRRGYRTSVRDIDQRKRMEEELHAMRRRAEAAATARAQLLANVSHELRSPVHYIAGFAELLALTELSPEQREHVARIHDQTRALTAQVEDLLQLSAFEAGGARLSLAPFDLRELLAGLLDAARPLAERRALRVEGHFESAPRWLEGDAARLAQVVRNLVENAIKFTDEGFVRLIAASDPQDPGILVITVEDSGIGIAPDRIDRLLRPFEQADPSSTRTRGGVGLGLAICARIVRAMGGSIALQSREGEGTRARVRLPLPTLHGEAAPAVSATTTVPTSRGHALVVDDSDTARELHRALLQSVGWTSDEAPDGEAAEELARERSYDAILLDYQMPGTDGAELAMVLRRALSDRQPDRHVPILMLTANVFAQEQLGVARSTIDAVLTKPLSRAVLARRLRHPAHAPHLPGVAGTIAGAGAPPGLDVETVAELGALRDSDGQTLLARLLPRVAARMERALSDALAAVAGGDLDAVADAAHRAAGEAGLVGAREACLQARAMERRARDASPDLGELRALHDVLRRAWEGAREELSARLRGVDPSLR